MFEYRKAPPQLSGRPFLTDGGLETTLIFHEGHELPHFAAFHLMQTAEGERVLLDYFRTYAALAAKFGGSEFETPGTPIVLSGCIGPRGDGYVPGGLMSAPDAERYHGAQVDVLADTACDLVSAFTLNYVEEAIGIARAARKAGIPVVISFTLETDGRLPTGQALGNAIRQVDDATAGYPAYFTLNCAHPTHIAAGLSGEETWTARLRGLRVNASRMSHADLNDAPELDDGSPVELGVECAVLVTGPLPEVNILGGCCGTDNRHVEQIAAACFATERAASDPKEPVARAGCAFRRSD